MKISEYPICYKCFQKATWHYAGDDWYACDEHVSRGCSCNLRVKSGLEELWDDKGNNLNSEDDWEEVLDEQGRKHPCVDWNQI